MPNPSPFPEFCWMTFNVYFPHKFYSHCVKFSKLFKFQVLLHKIYGLICKTRRYNYVVSPCPKAKCFSVYACLLSYALPEFYSCASHRNILEFHTIHTGFHTNSIHFVLSLFLFHILWLLEIGNFFNFKVG